MSETTDREDQTVGGITWHSSDEDSGPDVGLSLYLGPNDRLFVGEISRDLFERCACPFDNDFGWFLVRYAPENETQLIAKFSDTFAAQEFIEQIGVWVRSSALMATDDK